MAEMKAGPKVLQVKGLYLGMHIFEACKVVNKLLNSQYVVNELNGGQYEVNIPADQQSKQYHGIYTGIPIYVKADATRKVTSICFYLWFGDKIFNSTGIKAEDFVQEFINAYHVPSMEPIYSEQEVAGWEFVSIYGYKVYIDLNKNISIEAITKKSEFKFD